MKHLFFLLTLLFCQPLAAQQTYRARVVDAETGDALPYAQVYISEMNGALTDGEGWFTVEAKETDVPPVLERIPRCGLVGGIFVNNHF
jgi:hypothetical protein